MSEQQDIDFEAAFMLGDWRVEPASGRLSRGVEEHRIEPKAMNLLVCLAQQPGQVLSRELLEDQVWAGMVVGYDSLAGAIIKLRKALGDDSKNPRYIETVPKRGYRLICKVSPVTESGNALIQPMSNRINRDAVDQAAPASTSAPDDAAQPPPVITPDQLSTRAPAKRSTLVLGILLTIAILMLVLITAILLIEREKGEQKQAESHGAKPVIAVLPFKNLSDDTQQDYFSDGITADLITDLSKLSALSVIARSSMFSYRNLEVDIDRVRQELGVNYIVDGSIRKVANRVRISARLIDASNSINLWAERFDGTLDDVFGFQDKVTSQIIAALEIKLTDQERNRLAQKYSNSIEAYDEFLRGWQNLWLLSREGIHEARVHFRSAIDLDSTFGRAYADLALTYVYDYMYGGSGDSDEALHFANQYADQAIALDPNLPQVYWVKGFADIFNGDYQQSLQYAQQSIDLDPNFADGYGLLATTLNYAGMPEQADVEMRKAMRLDPMHPSIYNIIHGEILYNLHDYQQAIENFEFALDANPESEESRLWLASALAHVGNIEEASWQLDQLRMSGVSLSLQHIEAVIPFKDPAQRRHFIDGLNRAGLTD